MSKHIRLSRYDKPVPEPHFIPGYTGHCPELPDHIGMTYPWATYSVLDKKPSIAHRLAPLRAPVRGKRTFNDESEDDKIIRERRSKLKNPLLGVDVTIGYGGHVPKVHEVVGKTHQHVFRKSIAEFERQQRRERNDIPAVQTYEIPAVLTCDRLADKSRCCCCCCCCSA